MRKIVKIFTALIVGLLLSIPLFMYMTSTERDSTDTTIVYALVALVGIGCGLGYSAKVDEKDVSLDLFDILICALVSAGAIFIVSNAFVTYSRMDFIGADMGEFFETLLDKMTNDSEYVLEKFSDFFIISPLTGALTLMVFGGRKKNRTNLPEQRLSEVEKVEAIESELDSNSQDSIKEV